MSDHALTLSQQGWQKLSAGDLDGAVEILTRAIMANDKDADAKALLGMAYSQKGLHAQAKRALQTAVEMTPGNADFRCNYGVVRLEHAGELPAAASVYQQALQINPHHELSRQRLQAIGPVAPLPQAAAPSHPPFQQHPQAAQATQMPVFGTPVTDATSPWQPASAPPTQPEATAVTPAQANKPGHVTCARCGQETRQGLSCEWCNAALRPPTPVPQQTPPPAVPSVASAHEGAIALAALDAHKTTSRNRTSEHYRNIVLARIAMGVMALVVSSLFGFSRIGRRAAARDRRGTTITLNVNGQPTQFKGAIAAFDASGGGTLTIQAASGTEGSLLFTLPAPSASPSQLAGKTLSSNASLLSESVDGGDMPDFLNIGEHMYLSELLSAGVTAATDRQITFTLEGAFREIDTSSGQIQPAITVNGTMTLKVIRD